MLALPSGRAVRGARLQERRPSAAEPTLPDPQFALYLRADRPDPTPWPARWVRWPDFRLPADRADAREALVEAWQRSEFERVLIACAGGVGRTGTALSCLAVLDGMSGPAAVAHVRAHYHRRAVETPGQRRYVTAFAASAEPA